MAYESPPPSTLARVAARRRLRLRSLAVEGDCEEGSRRGRLLALLAALLPALLLCVTSTAQAHVSAASTAIEYGPGENETLETYPATHPNAATLIVLPEGGFHMLLMGVAESRANALRNKYGFATVAAEYPVDSPTTPAFPAAPEAIENAVAWAREHAREINGDPERIVLVGGSSGGGLALAVAEHTRVAAVASLSGPTDFVRRAEEHRAMRQALGCLHSSCDNQLAHEWQPVSNIGECTPTILFGAELRDLVPLEQQTEMAEAMLAHGCPVTLDLERSGHAFDYSAAAFPQLAAFVNALGH